MEKVRVGDVDVSYFGEFGVDFDGQVVDQISKAAKLPVAVKAAVMPDAHVGYALPIGGVIALDNAISPNFVGVDIACRMMLSVWPHDEIIDRKEILSYMRNASRFGIGASFEKGNFNEHEVMDDPLWNEIPVLKDNKEKARQQLGSSGGGNHFFNFMEGIVVRDTNTGYGQIWKNDEFHAIMTHSGSRGPGHATARYYYEKAVEYIRDNGIKDIPNGYQWLPMDHELGQEYWCAMNLMGRYASANHHCIHDRFFQQYGLRPALVLENHHNFAWKTEGLYVHRKGATPAFFGEFGIIPGTGQTGSFVTRGLGNAESLYSSSHGAGRVGSRKQAKKDLDTAAYLRQLEEMDIMTSGIGADETYQAYKDIERVINLQITDNVLEPIAVMRPRIVMMGGSKDRNNPLDRVTITDGVDSE